MNRKFWLLRGLRFALFAALFIAALGFGTMHLWNWLMPELFHLPAINLGQTYGLLLLGRLLFGFKPGGNKHEWARHYKMKQRMAERMSSFSTEDKEKFRQQMRARCAAAWGGRRPETTSPPAEATA
jgi:hypothetical protein